MYLMHADEVVYDVAERGIKLNTDYATILTQDERQKSSLIQAVGKH